MRNIWTTSRAPARPSRRPPPLLPSFSSSSSFCRSPPPSVKRRLKWLPQYFFFISPEAPADRKTFLRNVFIGRNRYSPYQLLQQRQTSMTGGQHMKQHSNYTGWTMQAGEAWTQRQVKKDRTESSATISTVYADKHYTNSERWAIKCTKLDKSSRHLIWRPCPSSWRRSRCPCWRRCHLRGERRCGRKCWVRSEAACHHW